jgi:hypothetical protein
MKECEICGRPGELHHIVFRSAAKYMQNVPVKFKYLCFKHHRGNDSPHMCKKTDVRYKLGMQKQLFKMFGEKEYFQLGEIQRILNISGGEVSTIVKRLQLYKEGYKGSDIVIRCMGGRLYAE